MKKTLLIVAVILISTSTAFSQFKFGAGAAAGTKATFSETSTDGLALGFGLHVRGLYSFSDDFEGVAGFTYYLPKKIEGISLNQMGFNFDFHYNFTNDESAKAYILAGGNYSALKLAVLGESASEWGFGFQFGAGVEFSNFFIEAAYELEKDFGDGAKLPAEIKATVGFYF